MAMALITRMLRLRPEERPPMAEVELDPLLDLRTGHPMGDVEGSSPGGGAAAADHSGKECVVCMDAARTHLFVPCGHQCVCAACAETLRRGKRPCPMCRGPIRDVIKVHKAGSGPL